MSDDERDLRTVLRLLEEAHDAYVGAGIGQGPRDPATLYDALHSAHYACPPIRARLNALDKARQELGGASPMPDEPKPPPMRVVHKGWNTREEEVETAEVVGRLRDGCPRHPGCGQATLDEAAAEIAHLRARVAELEDAVHDACAKMLRHRLRAAELEAALREARDKTQETINTGGRIYDPAGIVDLCDLALGGTNG